MTDYTPVASRALATVTRKGVAVTFSHTTAGSYDAATDTTTGATVTTVTGYAVGAANNPITLQALSLITSDARTLYFTPTTFGQMPSLLDSVTWGGNVYAVKKIDPTSPAGDALGDYVIISR